MARKNYKELTEEQVREIAVEECARIGYDIIDVKMLQHPDDDYLRHVIAFNKSKKEYATWMLNIEMGGLAYGHYFDYWYGQRTQEETYEVALKDFFTR